MEFKVEIFAEAIDIDDVVYKLKEYFKSFEFYEDNGIKDNHFSEPINVTIKPINK